MALTVMVYAIADKYHIPALCKLAAGRFLEEFNPEPDIEDYIQALRNIDEYVYEEDRTLWDIAIPSIRKHIKHLLPREEFQQLLNDTPDLQNQLLALLDTTHQLSAPRALPRGDTQLAQDNFDILFPDNIPPPGPVNYRARQAARLDADNRAEEGAGTVTYSYVDVNAWSDILERGYDAPTFDRQDHAAIGGFGNSDRHGTGLFGSRRPSPSA